MYAAIILMDTYLRVNLLKKKKKNMKVLVTSEL